jgi:hypothetical protein
MQRASKDARRDNQNVELPPERRFRTLSDNFPEESNSANRREFLGEPHFQYRIGDTDAEIFSF